MEVTIDIPEPLFRKVEARARFEHCSPSQVISAFTRAAMTKPSTEEERVATGHITLPIIYSDRPDSYVPPPEGLNDFMFDSDDVSA